MDDIKGILEAAALTRLALRVSWFNTWKRYLKSRAYYTSYCPYHSSQLFRNCRRPKHIHCLFSSYPMPSGNIMHCTMLVKCLQVELVLSFEDRFQFLRHFSYFHDKLCIKSLTVYPHKDLINSKLIAPVMRLLRGENYTSAEHISQVLNLTKVLLHHGNNTIATPRP